MTREVTRVGDFGLRRDRVVITGLTVWPHETVTSSGHVGASGRRSPGAELRRTLQFVYTVSRCILGATRVCPPRAIPPKGVPMTHPDERAHHRPAHRPSSGGPAPEPPGRPGVRRCRGRRGGAGRVRLAQDAANTAAAAPRTRRPTPSRRPSPRRPSRSAAARSSPTRSSSSPSPRPGTSRRSAPCAPTSPAWWRTSPTARSTAPATAASSTSRPAR